MTTTVINNTAPFGLLTNRMVSDLYRVNMEVTRLRAAVATAASGYTGTAGVEYEDNTTFGVQPGTEPGKKGGDYSYAVGTIGDAWTTFWTAVEPALEALDNGSVML